MIYSARHHALIFAPRDPARVLACIPDARQFDGHVAVPLSLHNMIVCRMIGAPSVAPIEVDYDWPGRFTPFDHQKKMAAFFTMNPRSFNLADMGTGKTLAALWAADWLMRAGIVKKCLIIAPLSTLNRVWSDEIFTHFLGRRTGIVVHGSRGEREDALRRSFDFYIINHDGLGVGTRRTPRGIELGGVAERVHADPGLSLVIVDEASAYKNSGTRRWRILRQVIAEKPIVWMLTGTPTPNAPTDAWALKKLLDPKIENQWAFRDRTMFKVSQFIWRPRANAHEVVANFLQPAIRYARADCLDLPPVTIETREVEFSPAQRKAYDEMKRDLALTMKQGQPITAVNEAVLRMKLIQISLGAIYDGDHEAHYTDAGPRLAILREVCEEAAGKILVFAPLTAVVELIYRDLTKAGLSVAMVTGGTSSGVRSEIFRAFQQDGVPRIIVADPGCMAHGLTLTAGNTVVWYGPTDRPEIYDQANARINRPGQVRNMLIVRLVGSPIEKAIFDRLHSKGSLQGLILDMVKGEK